MNLSYYLSFFHDGSLLSITYLDDQIDFEMCSAGLIQSENRDQLALDDEGRVYGILSVSGIRNVLVNNELFYEKLRMKREGTELLDFEIKCDRVELGVLWDRIAPNDPTDFSYIVVSCSCVSWKDIPNHLEVDVSDLLRWPIDYVAVPFSLVSSGPQVAGTEENMRNIALPRSMLTDKSSNSNWPPGRDRIEATQNGWKLVSGNEQNAAHFQEVKNLATGDVWRFDRAKLGAAGPRGTDHWHHLNTNEGVPERYLDIKGKPCLRKREASRIYYRTGNSQQLPSEGNPVLSFAYYMGFFHDGTVTAIKHSGDSLEIILSSSQVLPQYNCSGIDLDDEECFCGMLVLKKIETVIVNRTRLGGKLAMKSDQGELLGFDIESGRVHLGVMWLGCSQADGSCFSKINIWCKEVFWEPSGDGVILDISQLLKR